VRIDTVPPPLGAAHSPRARDGLRCDACGGPRDIKSPHVLIEHAGVRSFCSSACLEVARRPPPPPVEEPTEMRASKKLTLLAIGLGLATLTPCMYPAAGRRSSAKAAAAPRKTPAPPPQLPMHGPPEPTEEERAVAFASQLAFDAWVHPLPGPERRMPRRHSRAFGAERPGDRPIECRSGHCGVDLGGTIWGEPVLVVADGRISRLNRDPRRSGGKYVRVAHRNGTITSHYFHLAAIPRRLREGSRVRTGQIIGLLGETGVENSGPHLHFAVSVRPTPSSGEHYIDPEPLIALWPVKDGDPKGWAKPGIEPGVPLGATGERRTARKSKRKRLRQRLRRTAGRARETDAPSDAAPGASTEIATPPAAAGQTLDLGD